MHHSIDKTECFLDSLETRKLSKLVNNISNQFDHQYYLIFLLVVSEVRCRKLNIPLNINIQDVFKCF